PLGAHFKQSLGLSSFQQALLVAVPVIVGALGRIPVGALTDRYGGRIMFPVVSFATIVPVLFLGLAGYRSLSALLAGGFFLGLAGTSFAVGVPFVSAWFPAARRGTAIGVFGMGMGGTAISALTTVKLTAHLGIHAPFLIVAGALAVYGIVAALVLRDAPDRPVPRQSALARLGATLKLGITWQAAALYAVGFGGFVAFSVYLPTYLKNAYLLTQADAADKMAGFVLLAVLMRPVGGWLSDRVAPSRVHHRVPGHGRGPGGRRGRGVRPGRAARPGRAGGRGHRRRGRGRRPRRVRAAAGHGRHLRRRRDVCLGAAGAGRRGRVRHDLQLQHLGPAGQEPGR